MPTLVELQRFAAQVGESIDKKIIKRSVYKSGHVE